MKPRRIKLRIKIAVLDTGINSQHASILGHCERIKQERRDPNERKRDDPIKAFKSFAGNSVEDECGHGTRTAELLLRVAPHANLYVAKISYGLSDGNVDSAGHVAQVSQNPPWLELLLVIFRADNC
jgi:hypothetical protein